MRYISIDIETTGLDSEKYDVLSIGAIIEDTDNKIPYEELPKFHAAIKRQEITGSPFAINMNRDMNQLFATNLLKHRTKRTI
jgi:oligoribonuclease (3'-5' exoribonuclease)